MHSDLAVTTMLRISCTFWPNSEFTLKNKLEKSEYVGGGGAALELITVDRSTQGGNVVSLFPCVQDSLDEDHIIIHHSFHATFFGID